MKLVETFLSIDGEGKRTGQPTIFIRKYGCPLRCSYCDTDYSWNPPEGVKDAEVNDIIDNIYSQWPWCRNITYTGGEPLYGDKQEIKELLNYLQRFDYDVNVETNGSIDLQDYLIYRPNIWFTMDFKCPSSKMSSHNNYDNLRYLNENDVLKFVVGTSEDLMFMKHVIDAYKPRAQIYVSPVFGNMDPKDIVEFILKNEMPNVTAQIQLHKIIWRPDKQGV